MKSIAITFIIFFQFACLHQPCTVDPTFERTFNQTIELIKSDYQKFDGGLSQDAIRGIFYLQELTSIKSHYVVGDLSYYENRSDFDKDCKSWKKWYDNNKCLISRELSDKILENVVRTTGWMED